MLPLDVHIAARNLEILPEWREKINAELARLQKHTHEPILHARADITGGTLLPTAGREVGNGESTTRSGRAQACRNPRAHRRVSRIAERARREGNRGGSWLARQESNE